MTVTNISVIHGVAGVAGPMGPPGAGYDATSSSAFIVGLGGKTFIVPADLAYLPGTRVHFASTANPSLNWMEGFVVNYTDVNLYVTIDLISSTADGNPHLDWSVSLTGQPGTQGARGINGAAGVSGNRIWYGTAAPNGITYPPDALDGDFYHQNVSVSQQNYYGP